MNIYEYDICDGDKGIIIAESYENAVKLFEIEYPDVDPYHYEFFFNEKGYKKGAVINKLKEYENKEELIFIHD